MRPGLTTCSQYDAALHALSAARQRWAETSVNRRLALLRQIKDALAGIAPAWWPRRGSGGQRAAGGRSAGGGRVAGGPCALMVGCYGLIATPSKWRRRPFCGGSRCGRWRTAAWRCGWCPARSGIGCFCLVFALRYGCSQASTGPISTAMRRGHTTSPCRAAGQAGAGAWRRQCGLDCATGCATQAVY